MSVIAQYQVSVANPSTVGGASGSIQYFFSNPPLSLWNVGATGVNTPQQSSQIGQVPSATNASGQLQIYTQSGTPAGVNFVIGGAGEGKLLGQRFRVYASGYASTTTGVPTITPIIQLNKGTIPSPTYVTLGGGVASSATVATVPLGWSIAFDGLLDPVSATIHGFMKYQYQQGAGGGTSAAVAEAGITEITGLVLANAQGAAGFGLVCGITFSAGTTGNSASLTEFKIVQD
jgi:hypothetical protein